MARKTHFYPRGPGFPHGIGGDLLTSNVSVSCHRHVDRTDSLDSARCVSCLQDQPEKMACLDSADSRIHHSRRLTLAWAIERIAILMETFLFGLTGILAIAIVYAWHRFYYDYEITNDFLQVTWLGMRVRQLRLKDIVSVSKRRKFASENWANTWRPRHRILVIRKRSGFRKDFVITPTYRYKFRNQLESAIEEYQPTPTQSPQP